MVWPAVIGALAGGLLGGASADSQRKANHEELDFLRESREIMRGDTNTAYQRAVKDMMAAGLNPMLAYSQGGAQSAASPGTPSLENSVGAGVNSAMGGMSVMQGFQGIAQSAATTEQAKAQTDKIKSETIAADVNTAKAAAELAQAQAVAKEKGVSADVAKRTQNAEETRRIADAAIRQLESEYSSKTQYPRIKGAEAESSLKQLDVPRAEAEEKFFKGLGEHSPYLRAIIEMLRGGASARSIAR